MVWERHGDWHLNGSSADLRLGEAIPAGGLVSAGTAGTAHSITILLPNGQRMLCECYDQQSCSQGYRIPAINPAPSPAVWNMFVAVRNVLLLQPATAETAFPPRKGREGMAANVEMVAPLSQQGEVSLAPALRVLPSGRYLMSLEGDGLQSATFTHSFVQPLDWSTGLKMAQLRVGRTGVYRIKILDNTNVPRIEIEVLATSPAAFANESAGLKETRDQVLAWLHIHEGWSLHDFLRVYLQSRESLVL
jgi:hypothetical protein